MRTVGRWVGLAAGGVVLVAATLSTLLGTGAAMGQDWPQWRGANRDGKATEFTAPAAWPQELKQVWRVTVGLGDATPALVGDRLYLFVRQGEEEVTLCLNAVDGKEVWRDAYAARAVTGAAARHPGPRASPAVAEGKVVTLGVGGVLSCLDADKGTVVWRSEAYAQAVPQFFTAQSPIVVDGMCIVHLGGKGDGTILALDLATGEAKWKWTGEGPAYASPVLMTVDGTKQIVTVTETRVLGLATADGKLLWEIAAAPGGRCYNCATPIVEGQTVIYTGQGAGTRAVKIEKAGEGFAAKEVWSNAALGTAFNTPVLKDGFLYGLSDKGNLFCLNAGTGETAWTDATKRGGNFGAIVDAGSCIVALPSDGELIVFEASGQALAESAHLKVAETPVYAHPVPAGKRVFVKEQEALALWTTE